MTAMRSGAATHRIFLIPLQSARSRHSIRVLVCFYRMIPSKLNTAHLQLRPFSAGDAGAVLAYWKSDPAWEQFNASIPSGFVESDAAKFVADMGERDRGDRPNWAIVHEGSVVGVVSLTFEQDRRVAVIGYGVHGDLRGRGLSVEAASTVIREAFVCYPELMRIRAHTDAKNQSSMRVLEKLSFVQEGILRRNQFVKGRFVDEAIYGLLRVEWRG